MRSNEELVGWFRESTGFDFNPDADISDLVGLTCLIEWGEEEEDLKPDSGNLQTTMSSITSVEFIEDQGARRVEVFLLNGGYIYAAGGELGYSSYEGFGDRVTRPTNEVKISQMPIKD